MTSALPHSAVIRSNVDSYLDESGAHFSKHISALKSSGAYRNIYKITLALDAFLCKLPASSRPNIDAVRGVIQRVPVLISVGQEEPAAVELRRFLECVFWC